MDNKQSLGKSGEELAARYLIDSGLNILARNYRCPKGEMDIIALDGKTVVFIEVRTRRSSYRGWGEESITSQKALRLRAIATYYLLEQKYKDWPNLRFDVIAIRQAGESSDISWIKAAL